MNYINLMIGVFYYYRNSYFSFYVYLKLVLILKIPNI